MKTNQILNYKWTTKEGQVIKLKDMNPQHLVNCYKMMLRKVEHYYSAVDSIASVPLSGDIACMMQEQACQQVWEELSAAEKVADILKQALVIRGFNKEI